MNYIKGGIIGIIIIAIGILFVLYRCEHSKRQLIQKKYEIAQRENNSLKAEIKRQDATNKKLREINEWYNQRYKQIETTNDTAVSNMLNNLFSELYNNQNNNSSGTSRQTNR